MPLTKKEKEILAKMKEHYGDEEGESVFYASVNKGKLGAASKKRHQRRERSKKRVKRS